MDVSHCAPPAGLQCDFIFGDFPTMEVSIPMANTNRSHLRVRTLCEGAIMVALAQALSYLKFMQLPNGGSLTPAIFPIVFFALRWGLGQGLLAGFAFGLLQLIFDGAYAWGWQSMLLDYLVAFTPLGLAGLFPGPFHQRHHHLPDLRAQKYPGLRHLRQCQPVLSGVQRQLYAPQYAAGSGHCSGAVHPLEKVFCRTGHPQINRFGRRASLYGVQETSCKARRRVRPPGQAGATVQPL